MKHLKTIFACLLMAVLSIGQVWAAEQLAYTLAPAAGSNNSYASACDVTISGITWNVTGNAQQVPWRIGGKSLNGVNRAVYSKTAMSDAITKVELTVGAASSITVNSLKLVVASNADFSSVIDEVTETFAANSTITFTPTSPATEWSTGAYYKFIFNVSVSGTSNKFVAFTEAKFYKEVATATCETPTFSPAAGMFFGEQEITITTNTAGASIYYTTDGTTPSSSNGTLYDDPFSIDETTTIKAIAVKAGASDSEVAEATYTAGTPVSTFDIDFETNNLAAYVNWNFVNIASTTTTITAYAGTYYGKTSGTASASITTKAKYANPGLLTFYTSKESGNNTTSSWIVQVSEDGEDWSTEIATFDATTGDKGIWTAREADLSGHTNVYVRIAYSGSTAIRAIDNISLANASEIAKPTISGDENFLTSTEVSIACSTGGVTIYYTNDGTDPKTSDTKQTYSDPFSINETTTIRAIANLGAAWSAEATSKTFTKITPITVAAAIAAIPNKDDVVNDQYVAGIVCTAAPSLLSGGKLTYYISADGSETNRLQIYKGKNLNNTEFTAVSDLAIGDRVVVFGQLKNYNNTPEMNDGNYLVSKAAPAVAAPTFSPDGGGFMGETDVTISCATASSAIYYTLDGSAPSKLSTPYEAAIHLTATTTINAIAFVGDDASLVISKTFTLTAPMTVSEALTALDSENPINNVAVAGIISTAPSSNPSSGKLTYYISDDGSASDELEVYKGFGIGGASFSDKADLQVGDEVTVFGNLTIYNTTKEFAEGSRLIAFNRPQVAVESINLTESTAEVEEGKTVTLHASVVPANATNKTIVWSVQSGNDKASVADGVVTGIAAGTAVIRAASDEDATIFAVCTVTVTEPAPLSPWASVYTSNVELSGSQNVKVTITVDEEDKNFDGVKMNKAAAATFTIPAGTTNLYAHMAAWNGEAQTVTVSGDCFDADKSIDIVADANISGSGTTYDIDDAKAPMDYFKEIVLDKAVTEPTEITITAASGKRFVLFGVNQVGGVVPVLKSIEIAGDLTTKSGYKVGDALDLDGLTVSAIYTLNEVDQDPVDVTSLVNWSYDPLEEGQTSVTITATLEDKSDDITISDLEAVASADPKIYVSTLNVDFGSVEVGEAVPANETVTVTLTNVAAATATLGGTNPEAFSITPAALTTSGDITISILANTDAAATYSATLTISDDATENPADSKVINLSFAVIEPAVNEEYQLVSDVASLAAGDQIIIVAENEGNYYTLNGSISSQYFPSTAVSISAGIITAPTTSAIILGKDEDNWTMSMGGQLIGATAAKKASLGNTTTATNTWTIAIADNVATITNTAEGYGSLQFNYNNGTNPRFLNYASAQTAVAIYKKVTPEPPTPAYTDIRTGLTPNHYYTICYPKAMTAIQGATLWSFIGKDASFAYLVQEDAPFEAGKPYIMYATESTVQAVLEGADAAAGSNNGLHGTLSPMNQDALNAAATAAGHDLYFVSDDLLRRATGYALDGITPLTGNSLPAQRAYVIVDEISSGVPAPGKKVRKMPMQGQTTTGCELIHAAEAPAKMMINGQLFILRGEKKYDATGRLVK